MEATLINKRLTADLDLKDGDRSFIARITSDALDRDNEVLLPQGMDASEFEDNPVVFFNHNHESVPVGRVASLKRQADAWLAKVVLAMRPKDHVGEWLPDTLLSLIQQGVIRGVSVGALPVEQRRPTARDKELFGASIRNVISKWKLMELSVAPIPANQDALIMGVSKKLKAQAALDAAVAAKPKSVQIVMFAKAARPAAPVVDWRQMVDLEVRRAVAKHYGRLRI